MIKFFRKHNKQLLAILTVFLMIAFLGGTALSNFLKSRRGAQTIAHAFGKSLTQQQRDAVFNQCHILEQMQSQGGFFFVWSMPWLSQSQQYAGYDVRRLDPISYLILIQEAKEKGYQPDLTAARAALSEKDRDLTAFRLQNKISIQNMEAAVANFLMVQRLWQDVENGVQVSEMEVEQAARDQMETVNAELVAIHSKPLVDQTTLVSEEALQQQFEKYKELEYDSNKSIYKMGMQLLFQLHPL